MVSHLDDSAKMVLHRLVIVSSNRLSSILMYSSLVMVPYYFAFHMKTIEKWDSS